MGVIMIVDWAGWLLFILTYILVFCYRDARTNIKLLLAFIFVLSLHQAVALTNAYITTTIGATNDAILLHNTAIKIASHIIDERIASGAHTYQLLLAFFYKLFGPSLFLGEELSILAFLLSCFMFIKIYKMLGYSKNIPLLLILFGSLPSMVFFGSVTLRESWQVLWLMLVVYFSFKNLFHNSLSSWFGCIFFAYILCLFHEGFVIFIFLLAGLMMIYQLKELNFGKSLIHKRILSLLLTIIMATSIFVLLNMTIDKTPELEAFHALSDGRALSFITDYRAKGITIIEGRTSYATNIDISSLVNFVSLFLFAFINYLFAPFPWNVSNLIDIYAAFESVLRFILINLAIFAWYKEKGLNRTQIFFMISIYFLVTTIWALGTLNYGTSIRHNMLTYWILILLFGASLQYFSKRSEISRSIMPETKGRKFSMIGDKLNG